jgi:hypothetical protein
VLRKLEGFSDYADPALLHRRDNGLVYLNQVDLLALVKELGKPYFRMLFVRNPYDRLLSAYLNKLGGVTKKGEIAPLYRPVLRQMKQYLQREGISTIKNTLNITFEEFVEFIFRNGVAQLDQHFWLQSDIACLDIIDYDYIGRFEQLESDANEALSKLGVKEPFPSAGETQVMQTRASEKMKQYYRAENLYEKVYEVYRPDFDLLGYDPGDHPPLAGTECE